MRLASISLIIPISAILLLFIFPSNAYAEYQLRPIEAYQLEPIDRINNWLNNYFNYLKTVIPFNLTENFFLFQASMT